MKKGVYILAIILVLTASFASASYVCSDGNNLSKSREEIDLWKSRNLNGVYAGLTRGIETPVIKQMEARLLLDSRSFTLTDNSIVEGEFVDLTKYNVSLVNSTFSYAAIQINSETKAVDVGEIATMGGYKVFLAKSTGDFPGTGSVTVMVGKDELILPNSNATIITFNNQKFVLQLFSASQSSAIIDISKCVNESAVINFVADVPVQTQNTVNATNASVNNQTLNASDTGLNSNTNDSNINSSQNATETNGSAQKAVSVEDSTTRTVKVAVYITLGLFAIIGIFLFAKYMKNKRLREMPIQTNI
ncbi:MAG: hypothetical protein AABW63_01195 [Nanoarchaeota archaeon]